jgi:hypothetical protein
VKGIVPALYLEVRWDFVFHNCCADCVSLQLISTGPLHQTASAVQPKPDPEIEDDIAAEREA